MVTMPALANGVGSGSYPDLVGNPKSNFPRWRSLPEPGQLWYNPGAFVFPTGLNFGNAGRNILRNPGRMNFDMALFKHFAIKESMAFEFRAEAFNVFNHTEFSGFSGSMSCLGRAVSAGNPNCLGAGGADLFQINSAHIARILQLGAKFIF